MTRRNHKKQHEQPRLTVRTYLKCMPNAVHRDPVIWLSWCYTRMGADPIHERCQHANCEGFGRRVPVDELPQKYHGRILNVNEVALLASDGAWLVQVAKGALALRD